LSLFFWQTVLNIIIRWISWDLEVSFWVVGGFQICWNLQVFCIWLYSTASVLTAIYLSTNVHQLPTQGVAFWILMGRSLLIRVRKLVSSDVSTSWVGVLFGGHWWILVGVLLGVNLGDIWYTFWLVKVFLSLCLFLYDSTISYTSCLKNCPLIKLSQFKKKRKVNHKSRCVYR
jgi:hypothetical protein